MTYLMHLVYLVSFDECISTYLILDTCIFYNRYMYLDKLYEINTGYIKLILDTLDEIDMRYIKLVFFIQDEISSYNVYIQVDTKYIEIILNVVDEIDTRYIELILDILDEIDDEDTQKFKQKIFARYFFDFSII